MSLLPYSLWKFNKKPILWKMTWAPVTWKVITPHLPQILVSCQTVMSLRDSHAIPSIITWVHLHADLQLGLNLSDLIWNSAQWPISCHEKKIQIKTLSIVLNMLDTLVVIHALAALALDCLNPLRCFFYAVFFSFGSIKGPAEVIQRYKKVLKTFWKPYSKTFLNNYWSLVCVWIGAPSRWQHRLQTTSCLKMVEEKLV